MRPNHYTMKAQLDAMLREHESQFERLHREVREARLEADRVRARLNLGGPVRRATFPRPAPLKVA